MGNNLGVEMEDDGLLDLDIDIDEARLGFSEFQVQPMIEALRMTFHQASEMPVIKKKPDLSNLRYSQLYREIKAKCGLPANSSTPNGNWSLTREIMWRENGLSTRGGRNGWISPNLHRHVANMFLPNNRGERLMTLDSKVFISKFNKDGSRLVTAEQNSIIRISDSSKGHYQLLARMKARDVNWSILDIDFSPDGRHLAYSTWSDYFFVVPMQGTMDELQWLNLHSPMNRCGIFSIRFSPCGTYLIGGCNNATIYIANRETSTVTPIRVNSNLQLDINALCYVTDMNSNIYVSGDNDGHIKLWDMREATKGPRSTFLGHLDGITYIDSRNDGNYILSNSKDQSIKLWDLRMPSPASKVKKAKNSLPYLEWDYRWDDVPQEYYAPPKSLDGDCSIMSYRGHRVAKSLLRAKFSPAEQTGQRYIYTGCGTGRIIIYDILTGYIKEAIDGHRDIVRDLDWHPVRPEIVSSSWDTHVYLNTYKRDVLSEKRSKSYRRPSGRHARDDSEPPPIRRSYNLRPLRARAERLDDVL